MEIPKEGKFQIPERKIIKYGICDLQIWDLEAMEFEKWNLGFVFWNFNDGNYRLLVKTLE